MRKYNLSSGKVGAIAELMVSVDLAIKGYEVFRALSAACSSDLVIKKEDILLTVEVRTGQNRKLISILDPDDTVMYPKHKINSDIIAVIVHEDAKIHYFDTMGRKTCL